MYLKYHFYMHENNAQFYEKAFVFLAWLVMVLKQSNALSTAAVAHSSYHREEA
jgi:hypothetical protein